jgi:hypothetical protein
MKQGLIRFFKFVHQDERRLYEDLNGELSYWRIGYLARIYRRTYAAGLVLFIGFSFTYSAGSFLGVPPHQVSAQIYERTDPVVERVFSMAEDKLDPYVSRALAPYIKRRDELDIVKKLVNKPSSATRLAKDYLRAGLRSRDDERVFESPGVIAGAFISYDDMDRPAFSEITELLEKADRASDKLGFYLIDAFHRTGQRWAELRLNPSQDMESAAEMENEPVFGLGQIERGESAVMVKNRNITEQSLIFVTFLDNLAGNTYYVSEKAPGDYFVLNLSSPAAADMSFQYWLVDLGLDYDSLSRGQPPNSGD